MSGRQVARIPSERCPRSLVIVCCQPSFLQLHRLAGDQYTCRAARLQVHVSLSPACRTISSTTPANAFRSVLDVTQPLPTMQKRVDPARGLGALVAASMALFTAAWNTERGACTCKEQTKIHSKFGCDKSVDPASKLLVRFCSRICGQQKNWKSYFRASGAKKPRF